MNKILLIIQREYLSRVKKKSFLIMTLVGPILMAALFIVPIYLATKQNESSKILVVDDSYLFKNNLPDSKAVVFVHSPEGLDKSQLVFEKSEDLAGMLYIPEKVAYGATAITFTYKKPIGAISEAYIKDKIEEALFKWKLLKNDIDPAQIKQAKTTISLLTRKVDKDGKSEATNTETNSIVGLVAAIIIYMLIFMYGSQVMRGVIEEKTNRIIEVMISSVKPFELMMGKIVGLALVGLTQFALWIVLTMGLNTLAHATILKNIDNKIETFEDNKEQVLRQGADLTKLENVKNDPSKTIELYKGFASLDVKTIAILFFFYFLGGYLLYSALFAAAGSAVDNEADTQQFVLPITIPLIFSFVIAQGVIQNPDSEIAVWCSIIPFTSPVIMMVRLPFGTPPMWQLGLSMLLLVVGFILTTWLAGRIYRTGILMYGKKPTWKELGKWLFYKG